MNVYTLLLPRRLTRLGLGLGGLLLSLVSACSYTKEVPPACAALPTALSYKTNVLPVLQADCYRCHSANNYALLAGGVLNMEDFNALKYYATPANGLGGVSYVVGSIQHRTDLGFKIMPYDGASISACDIAVLKAWVDSGALNN